MPVNVDGTIITGGTSIEVTDSSSRQLFKQDSTGRTFKPRFSGGGTSIPLFSVGIGTGGWVTYANQNVVANDTSGDGYQNVGGCYNTTNGRFTAPWTGVYLFTCHLYCYSTSTALGPWFRPMFYVNGSINARRPNAQTGTAPYRMRLHGIRGTSGFDGEESELIRLEAGDYVNLYFQANSSYTQRIYQTYSAFKGVFIGETS